MSLAAIITCIVGAISILGTVVTVTAVIISMKSSVNDLKARDSEREKSIADADQRRVKKEEEIDRQVVDLLVTLKGFMSSQVDLNVTVRAFMEAQTDINQKLLVEVGHLTKASTEGTQVISLLTEVLRQKKVIASE